MSLKSKNAELLGKVETLNTKNSELLGKIEEVETPYSELLGKVEPLKSKNAELLGKIETLNAKNSELLGKIEPLETKNAQLIETVEYLTGKITDPKPENFEGLLKAFTKCKEGRITIVALATLLLGLAFWGFSGRQDSPQLKKSKLKISELEQTLTEKSQKRKLSSNKRKRA